MRPLLLARSLIFCACALFTASAAHAQTADFTGSLSIFTDTDQGLSNTAIPIFGSATGVAFGPGGASFTIPSGVFVTNRTTPGGFTANAAPNSIYTVRTITNQSNGAGSFSGTPTAGPFSGVMGIGSVATVLAGIVPLPSVFGTIAILLDAGLPGTATATGSILGITVSFAAEGTDWTTGITTVLTSPASPAIVTGTNGLSAAGGTISLVTPFLIRSNLGGEPLAGYARLDLSFTNVVPEPMAFVLLALATASLALGRRARR